TRFLTGPFNGCDFAAAYSPNLGTTVFHAQYGTQGNFTSQEMQRHAIVSRVESLGYSQNDITHYMPASEYLSSPHKDANLANALVYGEVNPANRDWSFYRQSVIVEGGTLKSFKPFAR